MVQILFHIPRRDKYPSRKAATTINGYIKKMRITRSSLYRLLPEHDDEVTWEEGDFETCGRQEPDNVDWEVGADVGASIAKSDTTITSSPLNEFPFRKDFSVSGDAMDDRPDFTLKSSLEATDGFSSDFISSPSKATSTILDVDILDVDKSRAFSTGNSDVFQAESTAKFSRGI